MKKLIIILGVVGVSSSALLVRFSEAPSLTLVVYRMVFASLLLLPYAILTRRSELKNLSRRQWCLCLLSGFFLGLHFFAYFTSLSFTTIAAAVVLVDTEVFWVAIAMFLLTREIPGKRGKYGILLAFGGSVFVAVAGGFDGSLAGNLIALSGAFFMAIYTVIGRLLRQELSTTVYTTLVYCTGAVTTCLMALLSGTALSGWGIRELGIGFALAVFCTLLGHSVFSWGLKYEKASYISTVKFLEPVFAAILGFWLLSEIPSLPTVIGGLVILSGVLCYSFDYSTPSPQKKQIDRINNRIYNIQGDQHQ